jgi:hypothetical protein
MERFDTGRAARNVRLGPFARGLLARRRRWLRWAAAALAVLTILSAAAQLRRPPASRRGAAPAANPHRPATQVPAAGGAARLPAGMGAMNLLVPAAAIFDGRLVPRSHVDLLAAFETGPDRVVRPVLTSGLVLSVVPRSAAAGAGSSDALGGRFTSAPLAELSIAVPVERERDLVMAQAFGWLYIAVRPEASRLTEAAVRAGPGNRPLSLRTYLGLPPLAAPGNAAFRDPASRAAPAQRHVEHAAGVVAVDLIEGTSRRTVEVTP